MHMLQWDRRGEGGWGWGLNCEAEAYNVCTPQCVYILFADKPPPPHPPPFPGSGCMAVQAKHAWVCVHMYCNL